MVKEGKKKLKVALLGNMNNNHFSMMRYLRDLEVDAYLLLYKDDGIGASSHFVPENDTWDIEKWKPFIIQTELKNGGFSSLKHYFFPKYVKKIFDSYDAIIGNGFAPSYAFFAKRKLDIFTPYAIGGEFLNLHRSKDFFQKIRYNLYKKIQYIGVSKHTQATILYDSSEMNIRFFNEMKLPVINLPLPMVYTDSFKNVILPEKIKQTIKIIEECDLTLFSHVSHSWITIDLNASDVKKNNILIEGFAKYVKQYKNENYKSKLILVEYGKDVQRSKELIKNLDITEHVIWLPKISRKDILVLLDYVSLGCGELGGIIWGGTGWEFLSKGVPFFQYVEMSKKDFLETTKTPFPPLINVNTSKEIAEHLFAFEQNPKTYDKIREQLKEWFKSYNGKSVMKKYLEIIENNL